MNATGKFYATVKGKLPLEITADRILSFIVNLYPDKEIIIEERIDGETIYAWIVNYMKDRRIPDSLVDYLGIIVNK